MAPAHVAAKASDCTWPVRATTPGAVREGRDPTAAATLTLDDEALVALTRGEATAQQLYQKGQLRVDGEVRLAQRLGLLKGLGG